VTHEDNLPVVDLYLYVSDYSDCWHDGTVQSRNVETPISTTTWYVVASFLSDVSYSYVSCVLACMIAVVHRACIIYLEDSRVVAMAHLADRLPNQNKKLCAIKTENRGRIW